MADREQTKPFTPLLEYHTSTQAKESDFQDVSLLFTVTPGKTVVADETIQLKGD